MCWFLAGKQGVLSITYSFVWIDQLHVGTEQHLGDIAEWHISNNVFFLAASSLAFLRFIALQLSMVNLGTVFFI